MQDPLQVPPQDRMRVRHVIGLSLAILTIPLFLPGLIDPIEGGIAMLVVGVFLLTTWLVSRIPVPQLEWISWTATMVVAVAAVTAGTVLWQAGVTGPGLAMPWWMWGLIGMYEIGVVATLTGGIQYVVRHVKALRHHESGSHELGNHGNAVHA